MAKQLFRHLALLGGLPFALAAYGSEQAHELAQSGTWHVARVTATESRMGPATGNVTVTDAGDFAFEDHGASFNRMVLYLDKAVPSRALQRFYPLDTTLVPRRYNWFWEADPVRPTASLSATTSSHQPPSPTTRAPSATAETAP